jgi:chemotaxis protein MotA
MKLPRRKRSVVTGIPEPARTRRFDFASLAVLPAGILIVLLAQLLEGGAARSLLHGPAALIVFGGTLAALLVSYSPSEVRRAIAAAARTFHAGRDDTNELTAQFVSYSIRAQRKGVLVLDPDLETIQDPFIRAGLTLVVDGVSMPQLKEVLAVARAANEGDEDAAPRLFEAAAGYAPTLGILGAVLGLIQVMEHLSQPGALGSGIAVAFVSTVYGVGAANLLFLPIAGRLRERAAAADRRRELICEGLYALHQRLNPRLVAQRLAAFSETAPRLDEIAARVSANNRAARVTA